MDEIEKGLHQALTRHRPARLVLYQGEEVTREITVSTVRKKWAATLVPLCMKLPWSRVELRDKAGGVLDVIEVAPEEPELALATVPGPDAGMDRMLDRMLRAQQVALTYRQQETQQALTAIVDVMREMGTAVHQLTTIYKEALAASRSAAPAASVGGRDDLAEGMELAKLLLPLIAKGKLPAGDDKEDKAS